MSELDWKCGIFFVTFIKIWLYQIKNESAVFVGAKGARGGRGVRGLARGVYRSIPVRVILIPRSYPLMPAHAAQILCRLITEHCTKIGYALCLAVSPAGGLYVLVRSTFIPFLWRIPCNHYAIQHRFIHQNIVAKSCPLLFLSENLHERNTVYRWLFYLYSDCIFTFELVWMRLDLEYSIFIVRL